MLVCPWSPGGGTDRVSRQVAAQLEREIGVPVNVINATGGGGVTGHTRGALARPDGYTLMMATVELSMLHWRGLTELSYQNYEPLALLNRDDAAVFVRQDAPWQTITELEAAIRDAPEEFKASGTARGGIWHIALAGWLTNRGMPVDAVTWISINGAGPSLQELMADGVDMVCCSVPEARSLMDGSQVRCLGVMADNRVPSAPDVPTFPEQGVDWTMGGWRGLMFPKGVPADRGERMQGALLRVARSEEFAEYMDSAGFNLSVDDGDGFEQLLAEVDEQFGAILTGPAFARVSQSPFGPMVFPGVVMGIGGLMVFVLLCRGQLRRPVDMSPLAREHAVRLAWVPFAVVFFILASDEIGFILSAGVMLLGLLLAMRVRVLAAAALTVVLVPAVYQVFAVQLRVPLPSGWLGW